MKHLIKILFLLAFIAPFTSVSATTHDDATMDVIEHSSSERYEHEIELPNDDDAAHEKEDHNDADHGKDDADEDKNDSMDDKDDSSDDKDDSKDNSVHSSHDD